MPPTKALAEITDILLDDNTGADLLSATLEDYRELLLTASGFEPGEEGSLSDIRTDAGVAIGTTWAALCLDDGWRTKRFVTGLFDAVTDLLADRADLEPIHVFYAGTGPWATLFMPLTTRFTADQLRVTALEINPVSVDLVRETFLGLGVEDYLEEVIEADAARYRLSGHRPVDILLSETMQHTLVSEMQIPIVVNLLRQLPEQTILIPETIRVHLGVMNDYGRSHIEEDLGVVFTFNAAAVRNLVPVSPPHVFPTFRQIVPLPHPTDYVGPLALLTTIHVYGDQHLTHYESVLTYPQTISDYPSPHNPLAAIDFTYVTEPEPELEMDFLVRV